MNLQAIGSAIAIALLACNAAPKPISPFFLVALMQHYDKVLIFDPRHIQMFDKEVGSELSNWFTSMKEFKHAISDYANFLKSPASILWGSKMSSVSMVLSITITIQVTHIAVRP